MGDSIILYDASINRKNPNSDDILLMVGRLGQIYHIPSSNLTILHNLVQTILKKIAEDSGVQNILKKDDDLR